MKTTAQPPRKRARGVKSAVIASSATLAVLGSFGLLGTTTAAFSVALLACAILVVQMLAAEWTRFDVNDHLFGRLRGVPARPAPTAELIPLRVACAADPADHTLPHAA